MDRLISELRRSWGRWAAVGIGSLMMLWMVGCATKKPEFRLQTQTAKPVTFTDARSRALAQRSRQLRPLNEQDYKVGPGDQVELSIFEWELREETKTALFRVAESGVIAIPVVGTLDVGGASIEQIKQAVEDRLREGGILKQPQVTADIKEFRSKRVSVVGSVVDPGVYTLRSNVTTLREILSLAGGAGSRAGQVAYVVLPPDSATLADAPVAAEAAVPAAAEAASSEIADVDVAGGYPKYLLEPQALAPNVGDVDMRRVVAIDLYELLDEGNEALNMYLEPGSSVFVPENRGVSVIGDVKDPGNFALRRPTTLLDAIALAGGLQVQNISPARWCVLKRRTPSGDVAVPLNVEAISLGQQPDIYVAPGDVVVVPTSEGQRTARTAFETAVRLFSFGYNLNNI